MENQNIDLSTKIPGWGYDADKEKRVGAHKFQKPVVPTGSHWTKIPQQQPQVKINLSASRSHLTPVMGTMQPPKGLSGVIRNFAYTLVENRPSHWMLLLLADRVDVVESAVADFVYGPADETGVVSTKPRTVVIVGGLALLGAGALWLTRKKSNTALEQKKKIGSPGGGKILGEREETGNSSRVTGGALETELAAELRSGSKPTEKSHSAQQSSHREKQIDSPGAKH